MQLAAQRIEAEAERFERERAQQVVVAFFTEDDVGAADAFAVSEKRDTFLAFEIRSVVSGLAGFPTSISRTVNPMDVASPFPRTISNFSGVNE